MAKQIELTPVKTYKTRENATKAVEKLNLPEEFQGKLIRYFIATHTDGRFFPVFLGEVSIQAGIHFHFNVVA